jgi:tetratricopeptide (TPR) repeat protein
MDVKGRRALDVRPNTTPAAYDFYLRGRGYLEDYQSQDNLEKAIVEFEHAIAVDKSYAPAYAAMGLAYTTGFQWKDRGKDWLEKAATQCDRALAITPQLAEGHTCIGNVFFSRGRYEEAVQQFQRSLDLDHNNDETLRSLAAAYQKLGNPKAAEDAYRKAILLRPNYWGVYSSFGTFYYNQARYADAVLMFKKTIQLAPLYYNGYSNLGAMYLLLGDYKEAVEALNQSIALRPSGNAYGNLGTAYFYMRRYPESAENLQQALKIDADDWLNWGNLGDTLFQIPARRAEATNAYQKALDLTNARLQVNPRDAVTQAFAADYNAMIDRESQAKEEMARALQGAPADADVLFRAAILYNHFGEADKAIDFLGKSVTAGYSRTVIRDTPDFERIREDRRFRALLAGK